MKFRENIKPTLTTNLAGGEAYKQNLKMELVSLLLTSLLKDKFYEKEKDQLLRLKSLVKEIEDKKFIAKAAVYARNVMGMRSITHVLIVELLKIVNKEEWLKFAVYSTIKRPDDMLEILAYYKSTNSKGKKRGQPYTNALKKGLALAVNKFNEYQLGKYRGGKSSVKLVDILNIARPKPNEENKELFKNIVTTKLRSKGTWEVGLSEAGKVAATIEDKDAREAKLNELKGDAFKELILSRKIGYMALLKNLRNILKYSPDVVEKAIEMLTDEKLIKKSLVFPFRFATAYDEIAKLSGNGVREMIIGISKATDISLSNVPVFEGKTLIALDESGSMEGKPIAIGSLFAAILYKSNNADLLTFAENSRIRNLLPVDSTLSIANQLKKADGGGTNFHSIFNNLKDKYDRIVILSDMQAWMERYGHSNPNKSLLEYKDKFNANPKIYSFDLAGYGSLQFPEKNVYCIAGFSDKIFDVMKLLEEDRNALVNEIEKTKF